MVVLILALILLLALIALNFLALKNNKTLIMAGIVMLMLLLNIIDEITLPDSPKSRHPSGTKDELVSSIAPRYMLNASNQLFKNTPARPLVKQERTLLNHLLQRVQKQSPDVKGITIFNNIEESRFRAIFREFQQQQNSIQAFEADYEVYEYSAIDFDQAVQHAKTKKHYLYGIINGLRTLEQISDLQNFFLSHHNIYLLFLNPPTQIIKLSSLSKWAQVYNFEGNYIEQVLENHPPRLVEICNKYRTIDYSFYILSQSEPLSQLCTKLPTNRITQCIRTHLNRLEDRVPYSKVRECWGESQPFDAEGVIFENGMVGVKKDYFYAGRVDKKQFLLEGEKKSEL